MIRVSDETLDSFIALRRKALNREYGSRRLEDMGRFEQAPFPRAAGHGKGAARDRRKGDHGLPDHRARRRAYARRGACRGRCPLLGLCHAGGDVARALSEAVRARGLLRIPRTIRRVRGRRRLPKSRVALAGPRRCSTVPRRAAPRSPPFRKRPPKPCAPAPPKRGNDRPTREVLAWIFPHWSPDSAPTLKAGHARRGFSPVGAEVAARSAGQKRGAHL